MSISKRKPQAAELAARRGKESTAISRAALLMACALGSVPAAADQTLRPGAIAAGASRDCNTNGIPDEEELQPPLGFAAVANNPMTQGPLAAALADFDADGDLDAAVATGAFVVRLMRNNGSGTLTQLPASYATGASPSAVIAPDLDGDGDFDAVTANYSGNNLSLFYNNGLAHFASSATVAVGMGSMDVVAGRFDGDADLDLISANFYAGTISVLLNTGPTSYAAAVSYAAGSYPMALAAGDIDADGDLDLAVANWGTYTATILRNNGSGAFASSTTLSVGYSPNDAALVDLDADDDLDLAIANGYSYPGFDDVWVLWNDGTGAFPSNLHFWLDGGPPSLAVADYDRDGLDDLALALPSSSTPNGRVGVLPNNGDQTFGALLTIGPLAYSDPSWFIVSGDLNGDGAPDLVFDVDTPAVGLGVALNTTPSPLSLDCDNNGVWDGDEIAAGDCNCDLTLDVCQPELDCDGSGGVDTCELTPASDCNGDGQLDVCQTNPDCNANGRADFLEVDCDDAADCNSDDIPDECQNEPDCNANGRGDILETACDGLFDCNFNSVPDECEEDCDGSGLPDECEVSAGTGDDCNGDAILDACQREPDCNCNERADPLDVICGPSADVAFGGPNGIPDECELLTPGLDDNPVTFSVAGPVGQVTDGIVYPPGDPAGWVVYTRTPDIPQATGVATVRPGDVNDYLIFGEPAEAEMFQSEPDPPPPSMVPSGTNSQILVADALGLIAGLDNVDAITWANDFIPINSNDDEALLPGSALSPLPPPPTTSIPWALRLPYDALEPDPDPEDFERPTVLTVMAPISFRMSWDPWSVGLAGTGLSDESGGYDDGALLGPWSSPPACVAGDRPDGAAGDVFATPFLDNPPAGTPIGGPPIANFVAHDERALGLNSFSMNRIEDDLDALECVGFNLVPWISTGVDVGAGDLHARVIDNPTLPIVPLGAPGMMNHLINFVVPGGPLSAPLIFSVTRASPGRFDTAVHTQYVLGEQSGDLFIAFTYDPDGLAGPIPPMGMNLLLVDEEQLGLMPEDDLDALILMMSDELKDHVAGCSLNAMSARIPVMGPSGMYYSGLGYTRSLTEEFMGTGDNWMKIGFSVTSDSMGLHQSAADYEARGLGAENAGRMQQCGDILFSEGNLDNTNYLWFEEEGIGGYAGNWTFPSAATADLALRPDELDGLDSIDARDPDLDGDGDVDGADLVLFTGAISGPGAGGPSSADLDADGDVDLRDYALLQSGVSP